MAAKNFIQIVAMFVIGMAGGVFASQVFWPKQSINYVTEKTETTLYVQENTAIKESVQDVLPAVVGIKTKTPSGEILEGSGLVLTSDGLIVTLASLVPQGSNFAFFVDGKWPAYQILKRDLVNDLALIKVEKGGLKSRGFVDMAKIKLAEPVFLVGVNFPQAITTSTLPYNVVNAGFVSSLNVNSVKTNIFEQKTMAGSPLFDIEGKVIGLSIIGQDGRVLAVPVNLIRAFAGL